MNRIHNPGLSSAFLADAPGDTTVELIQAQGETFSGRAISIGFATDALDRHLKQAQEDGLEPTEVFEHGKVRFFYMADPDGLRVQLVQPIS